MTISPERCGQLRKLHTQLTTQIQLLRENIQKEEREGVDTSLESLNTLKGLQSSLHKISLELEQCPPDIDTASPATAPRVSVPKSNRYFFPEEERAQERQSVGDEYDE